MLKKLICFLFVFVISFPLIPRLAPATSAAQPDASANKTVWENPYTLTTFGEGNRVNSTFFTFPKVIWNGSQYVDYVLNTSDMSAGIGSVYIKVFPDHSVFYEPDQKQERMSSENWTVEYLNASNLVWQSDSPVDNEVYSLANSSGIYFDRKSTLQSGAVLNVWYWLRIGSELKITVTLDPARDGDYRLAWTLGGVSGTKAKYLSTMENMTQQLTEDQACSSIQFLGDNESSCLVDWSDAVFFNSTGQDWETCFRQLSLQKDASDNRCQARILFADFPLTRGESLVLDPTVQTFNSDVTSEGIIGCHGSSYPPNEYTCMCTNGTVPLTVGQRFRGDNPSDWWYTEYRSYLSFYTFQIPAMAYNLSSATLKLKTQNLSSPGVNFLVRILGSDQSHSQPIYNNNLTADSWGCGFGLIATWNVSDYPGNDCYVNFTVPLDQINRLVNSTEFELNSSREGVVAPSGDEYVCFYPGCSAGNEPKLEVSYCLDTETIGVENTTWFYRNVSSDKVAMVFFGSSTRGDYLLINSIDKLTDPVEKLPCKIQFLDGLISNGFSILTPMHNHGWSDMSLYYYYSPNDYSTWVYDALTWLTYNQSYRHVFLFGFSGGE